MAECLGDADKDQLISDLVDCGIREELTGGSCWYNVFISGYDKPPFACQQDYGVAAAILDSDGIEIQITLWKDKGGRLMDIELIKVNAEPISMPDWNQFKILYY